MSTPPGDDPRRDAGATLSPSPHDAHTPPVPADAENGGRPVGDSAARPSSVSETPWTEAAEPDVLEQERGALPGTDALLPPSVLRDDAAEHDVLEQVQEVRPHDPAPPSTAALFDAAEHDVLEQAQDLLDDGEDEYPAQ